ncbi:MAG: CBS domain-containing protein [Roseburia sp.]|nr:CBS domain-containing protein [Roseburia sp.]
MRVKAIMMPYHKLTCINLDNTVEEAMKIIDEQGLLSLPVVREREFIGVLSKQYLFEEYFKNYTGTKEAFMQRRVGEFMKAKIDTIGENTRIEEAAAMFITSKVRFIPITNDRNILLGIVTQQAVFKEYQKIFGNKHNSMAIYTYDIRGVLGKICELIAKEGGDICNMMVIPTDVLDLAEIFLRVEAPDFERVVRALERHGYDVRDVKYNDQK